MPSAVAEQTRLEAIRTLNDQLRQTGQGGRTMVTPGIANLEPEIGHAVYLAVAGFSSFDAGNDPYHEHDFGAVEVSGNTIFWKIEYYDKTWTGGSPDPSDRRVTGRVLTIMLAEEY